MMRKIILFLVFIFMFSFLAFAEEVKVGAQILYVDDPAPFSWLTGSLFNYCGDPYYYNWEGNCKEKYNCNSDCSICYSRVVDSSYCGSSSYPIVDESGPQTAQSLGQMCFPNEDYCGTLVDNIDYECQERIGFTIPSWDSKLGLESLQVCDKILGLRTECYLKQSTFLAKNAFKIGDYYYADIDDVVYCPNGCDLSINQCKTSGDSGSTIPVPDCSEGYMRCGTENIFDSDGVVQKCINGHWVTVEDCSNLKCQEYTSNLAKCQEEVYYCSNGVDCYTSTSKTSGCYDSLDECQGNIVYYCLSSVGRSCEKRLGGCYSDETVFRGTDELDVLSQCQSAITQCIDDYDCYSGYRCIESECVKVDYLSACLPNDYLCKLRNVIDSSLHTLGSIFVWIFVIVMIILLLRYLGPFLLAILRKFIPFL